MTFKAKIAKTQLRGEGDYGTRSHTAKPYSCLQVWVYNTVLLTKLYFELGGGMITCLEAMWPHHIPAFMSMFLETQTCKQDYGLAVWLRVP